MLRYEILMLAHPEATTAQISEIETHIKEIVQKGKGSLTSFDNWGKLRLSYPVKGQAYGVYALVRYELPQESVTQILEDVKMYFRIKANDLVLRHVCKALAKDAPVSYEKPESVDAPREYSEKPKVGKVEEVETEAAEG